MLLFELFSSSNYFQAIGTVMVSLLTHSILFHRVDQKRVIQEFSNSVPFVLQESKTSVEVADALRADILDLETISDCFEPSSRTLLDHVWGFISGIRHQGVQVTEKMLKEGAFITGVGELTSGKNKDGLKLQPPSNGSPFYLTALPLSSLIRKLDDEKRFYRFLAFICGGVGLVIVGIMTRKWWRERTRKLKEQTRRQQTSSRIERQQSVQENERPEVQVCVVCCQNSRGIILLPCGHVCLCEDCSARITDFCPVCRAEIETKAVAYIS